MGFGVNVVVPVQFSVWDAKAIDSVGADILFSPEGVIEGRPRATIKSVVHKDPYPFETFPVLGNGRSYT